MAPLLRRMVAGLLGSGLSRRTRIIRLASTLCFIAAVGLFVTAALLSKGGGTTRRPLPTGTVFSVPVAALVASATPTPSPTPTDTPSPLASPTATPTASPTPEVTPEPTPAPTPEATPLPPPDDSQVTRLVIPSIKVDAPISQKSVDANGVMQNPNSWNDVAYYTFTGRPGFGPGNNAVFGGRVDYYPHRTAVFWDLRKLKPGDEVHVRLEDNTDLEYLVTQMIVYPANDAQIDEIVGQTPDETVTLITCDGTFSGGEYNNRLVVRAVRQPPQSQPAAASQ